jgi:hypothetical protein
MSYIITKEASSLGSKVDPFLKDLANGLVHLWPEVLVVEIRVLDHMPPLNKVFY